jgi:hypothetical protein
MARSDQIEFFYNATTQLLGLKEKKSSLDARHVEALALLFETSKWDKEPKIRIMAASFIPQYIQFFPDLQERALNVQIVSCS